MTKVHQPSETFQRWSSITKAWSLQKPSLLTLANLSHVKDHFLLLDLDFNTTVTLLRNFIWPNCSTVWKVWNTFPRSILEGDKASLTCRSLERYRCIGYRGSNSQTWALTLNQYIGFLHEIICPKQKYHLAWENINTNNNLSHSSIRNNPCCRHGHLPRQRSIQEAGLQPKAASFLFPERSGGSGGGRTSPPRDS